MYVPYQLPVGKLIKTLTNLEAGPVRGVWLNRSNSAPVIPAGIRNLRILSSVSRIAVPVYERAVRLHPVASGQLNRCSPADVLLDVWHRSLQPPATPELIQRQLAFPVRLFAGCPGLSLAMSVQIIHF